ncbi:MAG: hypothetical protein HOI70_06425 [Opitutae bacterium]|nr:hypothetical protein [Opitutae bacterium]
MLEGKTKILHLPSSVGGMAWALSQGEKKIGYESEVLVTDESWLDYPNDRVVRLGSSKIKNTYKLFKEFLQIRSNYDVFHFNFGSSLLNLKKIGLNLFDLPFYPKEKKMFMTFNGCDARQKYPTMLREKIAACHDEKCYAGMCNSGRLDRQRRSRIAKATKHIDHIFAVNPDLLYFLPGDKSSFMPYAVIDNSHQEEVVQKNKKFTIVHAPTQRAAKGSDLIISAVQSLQEKDSSIDLNLIENVPNEKALAFYNQADLIIDQVKIGWYGAFAVECMYMRKPVAVFINKRDLMHVPNEMAAEIPNAFIHINPLNIEEKLKQYIYDPIKLKEVAHYGESYAQKWHNPINVAKRIKVFMDR